MEERDRGIADACADQSVGLATEMIEVRRLDLAAARIEPADDADGLGGQRRLAPDVEVEQFGALLCSDARQVFEPAIDEQRGARHRASEQGIGAAGRCEAHADRRERAAGGRAGEQPRGEHGGFISRVEFHDLPYAPPRIGASKTQQASGGGLDRHARLG